jgi:cation diffusion facilitator family transporter
VLWITLGLNVVVSLAKIVVGKLTLSLSMVADGYHSLVDGSNNIVGLMVAAFAYAPPDRGHPYGHRKFESAATTLIAVALMALSYNVLEGALAQAKGVRVPQIGLLNWVVMLGTLAMNLFVSWYESREGHRLGSSYLIADAAHTRSDIYVSLGVIASFAGARAGLPWTDAVVATGIAVVIAVQAVKILAGSFHVLTDRAMLAPEEVERVVRSVPGVAGCRDVRTRGGPGAVYVDLVADVDGGVTLLEAHEVADRIEAAMKANHPDVVDVVVHLEPTPGP